MRLLSLRAGRKRSLKWPAGPFHVHELVGLRRPETPSGEERCVTGTTEACLLSNAETGEAAEYSTLQAIAAGGSAILPVWRGEAVHSLIAGGSAGAVGIYRGRGGGRRLETAIKASQQVPTLVVEKAEQSTWTSVRGGRTISNWRRRVTAGRPIPTTERPVSEASGHPASGAGRRSGCTRD
jgi:hypothetical protein